MTRKDSKFHIYNVPYEKDGKWIIEKTRLGELAAIYITTTKEEADKLLRKVLLLNMSIKEEFVFEFQKDNEFYYLTIPQIDRDSGTYSFSIKRMSNKDIVKFLDSFETNVLAEIQQKKLCGIDIPQKKEKKKVVEKKKTFPKKIKPTVNKKIDLSGAKQQEAAVFIKSAMIGGFSKKEISDMIKLEYGIEDDLQIQGLFSAAQTFFQNSVADVIDIPGIIQSHIAHYETVYQFFSESGNVIGTNKAMLQKEKLLGFHRKETVFEFNQENNISTAPIPYNLSVLEPEETNRLNHYLTKINVSR